MKDIRMMITIVVLAGGMLACTSPNTSSGRTPEAEQMLTELKEVSRQNHFLFGHHDDLYMASGGMETRTAAM